MILSMKWSYENEFLKRVLFKTKKIDKKILQTNVFLNLLVQNLLLENLIIN